MGQTNNKDGATLKALTDIAPAMLSSLRGDPGLLGATSHSILLFIIDGLGDMQLREFASMAPTLARLRTNPISAMFPCVTPVNLASIVTGVGPGEHGLVGTSMLLDGHRFHSVRHQYLQWSGEPVRCQMAETFTQLARALGVGTYHLGPQKTIGTSFTRALFPDATELTTTSPEQAGIVALDILRRPDRSIVTLYTDAVDAAAHHAGVGSTAYIQALRGVEQTVDTLVRGLPRQTTMICTADHGSINLDRKEVLDISAIPELRRGVRWVGGNIRVRHIYLKNADSDSALRRWHSVIGDGRTVLAKEEAIARGWFGATVTNEARARMGDIIAVDRGRGGIVAKMRKTPLPVADHGTLLPEERLVPLILLSR